MTTPDGTTAAELAQHIADQRITVVQAAFRLLGMRLSFELRNADAEPSGPTPAGGNAEDGPRCVCGDPIEWMTHSDGSGWIHRPGSDTPCLDARPAVLEWIDGDPLMEAIAAAVWEHCETEGTSTVRDDPRNIAAAAANAILQAPEPVLGRTDDAALRHLVDRAARGVATPEEGQHLRTGVEHLLRRVATLEHVAAGNKRHVQLIVPDLERAEAALTRVRAFADRLDADVDRIAAGAVHPIAAHIRAALDGPADGE